MNKKLLIICVLTFCLIISGCNSVAITKTPTPIPVTETPTQTPTPIPSPTATPIPYSSFEETNRFSFSNDLNDRLLAAEMSPDGKLIAVSSVNIADIIHGNVTYKLTVVKSDSGEVVYTFNLDQINRHFLSSRHFLAFSPDSQWLASAVAYDKTLISLPRFAVQLWNLADGKLSKTINVPALNGLTFSPDGQLLGAPGIGTPQRIYLWDAHTLVVKVLLQSTYYWGFTFHPSSPQFAAASSNDWAIHVIDIASKKEIDQFAGNFKDVNVIAYSPDGNLLAFSGYSGNDYYGGTYKPGDFSIVVWDAKAKVLKTDFPLTGYTGMVKSLAFSPDGTRLATLGAGGSCPFCGSEYSEDKFVRIYDVATGNKIKDINMDGGIESVSFNSDWTKMITGGLDRESNSLIIVWEVKSCIMATSGLLSSCGPGQLSGPTIMPTPTPTITSDDNSQATPTPSAGTAILFKDNFSSNANGWEIGKQSDKDGDLNREIIDSKYRMTLTSKQDYFWVITSVPNFSAKDFLFSIDATILDTSATPGNLVLGFTIREANGVNGKRYNFNFYNDNSYIVDVWPSADYQSIKNILMGRIETTKLEKGITNTFAIQANGSTFTFYINGNKIDTFTDTTINEAGSISLWLGLYIPGQSVTIEFDNLTIQEIP